jgi:DNA modification methylase
MESMFSTDELEDLLDNVGGSEELDGEDDVPEAPEKAISQLGDLYQLGQHRLLCGDSTAQSAVNVLMDGQKADMVFTDPPYGVAVVKSGKVGADFGVAKKGQYKEVIGDETTETACKVIALCEALEIEKQIFWGGNYYSNVLTPSSCWLIWDKRCESGIVNTFADAELAWTNLSGPTRVHHQLWNGMIRQGESDKRVHPTQKPVALAEWCFQQYTSNGETVLDLFGGSGSTMIASEKLNRKCYMMELDPQYCDVIVKRFNGLFPEIEILRNGEAFEPIHE